MDLKRLIEKIEKYTKKDLKFSMKEFKQLQKLRDDVVKLEGIMQRPGKDQAMLLDHYKEHAQKLERYSERIERRLNVWIRRLEKLVITEEQNLNPRDKQYFQLWINKIEVCKTNLIRILARNGELHKLINEKFPDWKKVEAKINEAFGDNKNPGIRSLMELFRQLNKKETDLKTPPQKLNPEEIAKKKIINILQPNLLIHGTFPIKKPWCGKDILMLPKTGLLPPSYTSKTINYSLGEFGSLQSGRRSSVLFLSLTQKKASYFAEKTWGDRMFRIFFIIDPKYVDSNPQNFVADNRILEKAEKYGDENEQFYRDFVRKKQIPVYNKKDIEITFRVETFVSVDDQILHIGRIYFKHIIGIVVIDYYGNITENIKKIVSILSKKYPDLAVPLYDRNGKLLWPK
jgi:hypothetical protein